MVTACRLLFGGVEGALFYLLVIFVIILELKLFYLVVLELK